VTVSLRLALLIVALVSVASGELAPCKTGGTSVAGQANGITIQRVAFLEASGEVGATVFIPEREEPVPGIVFSHSGIHGPKNDTDLRRFALALARAGAASIVLDGNIEWQTPNDEAKREPHVLACAAQWLLLNARLDGERLAIAGTTTGWGGENVAICLEGKRPCWHAHLSLNFGQTSPADWYNTDAMLTPEGQLYMARFAQRYLHLAEVKPEWLAQETPH
jgi:hypothetical protein